MARFFTLTLGTLAVAAGISFAAATAADEDKPKLPPPDKDGWISLFNGKDLTGWNFRRPEAKKVWIVCGGVKLGPDNPARLVPDEGQAGPPVLLAGGDGRGSDIFTAHDFDDYELHLEFTVPKGSNSGVYNRGLYEIQVLDSYGKPQLDFHDCGSLYERARPAGNPAKPPGEWQSFDIKLAGRKISLAWNGVEIFKDYDLRYGETDKEAFDRLNKENADKPAELRVKLEHKDGKYVGFFGNGGTRGSLPGPDRPGPILLQGDHGPVAYRNLKIRPLGK